MQLEYLKRWHWIVIGLLLGLTMGGARVMWGPSFDQNHQRELQGQLEKEVINSVPDPKEPLDSKQLGNWKYSEQHVHNFFTDIVVHPPLRQEPQKGYWITGFYHRKPGVNKKTGEVTYNLQEYFLEPVTVPYLPNPNYLLEEPEDTFNADVEPDPHYDKSKAAVYSELELVQRDLKSVQQKERELRRKEAAESVGAEAGGLAALKQEETALQAKLAKGPTPQYYFQQLQAKYPGAHISYRYAWEDVPWVNMVVCTVGMVLLVGGIWPTVIALLLGAGFGRPQDEGRTIKLTPDTSRGKGGVKPVNELTAADLERLRVMEAELEKNIKAGGGIAVAPLAQAAAPAEVAKLSDAPAAASKAPPTPQPSKAFGAAGGDFYPTEVHAEGDKKK